MVTFENTLPKNMRVIEVGAEKTPASLYITEAAVPDYGDDDVLIRIGAAGVNRGDCLQRMGLYPPPPGTSPIMGLEFAGEIIACGKDVTRWQRGDRVAALVAGGAYADYAVVNATHILPIPDAMDFTTAAALPEAVFTVWANLIEHGHLHQQETVLIHGGASGIGTMAIQMARLYDARIIVTAGSDEKCAACVTLGADHSLNYKTQDFVDEIKKITDGRGVDVVLDMVGGAYIEKNIAIMARQGRMVNIAYMAGARMEIDFLPVMLKNLTLTGSTLRIRPILEKARLTAAIEKHIWPHIGSKINPVIHRIFPLAQAGDAHTLMESNQNIGKIILDCQL